jgi:hypothetical protein
MLRKSPLALVAVLAGAVVVLLACGEVSGTASVVDGGNTSSSASSTSTSDQQHFQVGQHVQLGGFIITTNSVKTSAGDEFTTPKAGDTLLVIDVSIKNTTAQPQDISSALNFTLQDATGQKYDETVLSGDTPPDGTIPAGGLLRGQLVYEVPAKQTHFTFTFQPDITSTDQAIWDLHD